MNSLHRGVWLVLLCLLAQTSRGQLPFGGDTLSFGAKTPVVTVTPYWSATGVKSGGQMALALVLDIRKPYHINSNHPLGENYIPTKVELVNAPLGVQTSTPVFPEAHIVELGEGIAKEKVSVFSDRTIFYIPVSVTSAVPPGEKELEFKVSYQACNDKTCLPPGDVSAKAKLSVVGPGVQVTPLHEDIFAAMKALADRLNIAFFGWDFKIQPSKLWLLLIVAAVGGILLNFTPCVLPLIPIKIIGLSKAAGNRRRCFLLGLALSFGVVTFWLALAGAISGISGFNSTNKLFQYPAFTIGVGVIICAMAVGMCGLFSVRLPQWVYRVNPSQESIAGSVLFGIMTAVLSTPCTAPFMGAAAAWSATQKPIITFLTFAAIGLGMALPYLVLSAFPGLVRRVPRTGPASELIKQVMGLLMLAAGAYFLGTGLAGLLATPPDPPTDAYWWMVSLFIAAAGAWLLWRTLQIAKSAGARLLFGLLGALLMLGGVSVGLRFTRGSPIKWVYYTPERLAEAQKQNRAVVLEFTAAWCLNCHFLEKKVLHNPKVVALLNGQGITPIKVDLTGNNISGDKKLFEVGRRTIPYLVVYSRDGQEVFSSDAYTVEQLTDALKQVGL